MEEKKVVHLGVTGVLLIIAIIAMAVEGAFIWKTNKEKADKEQENANLQQRVNSLNVQVSELQGKLNKISGIVGSNDNQQQEEVINVNDNKIMFKGKYWIMQNDNGGLSSLTTFTVFDDDSNPIYSMDTDRLYEYRVDGDKFFFSNNENDYVKGISDVDKYYRVDYVLTEENGEFKVEEINRDYENVIGPAVNHK